MKKYLTLDRSNNIRTVIITVIFSFATIGSISAQSLTIDSCYAFATRNYPLIKQYDLIEKTKEYTLSNASKGYLPQLSVTAIEGYIFGGLQPLESGNSFKFIGIAQVNQTIWDGGATRTQKKIIEASSETDKASVDVALYDLHSRVNQLYFGILLVNEQLLQLEVQKAMLDSNVGRIKQLSDNGLAYKTDLNEIKVEQLKLDQKKTEYNFVRNGYFMMLSLLIGAKINEQTTLQKPVIDNQPVGLQIIRPELSMYKSQRNMVNAQAGMQRVNMMPKIGLLGAGVLLAPGIGLNSNSSSSIGVAGLSASWSTSGLYRNRNEKQLTQQSLNKINVQEQTFLFNTNLQMTQTSADVEKQRAILAADEEIVNLRKSIRASYQLQYDTGVSTLNDLLNASDKENEARTQKAVHELQLLMTLSEYKRITGN